LDSTDKKKENLKYLQRFIDRRVDQSLMYHAWYIKDASTLILKFELSLTVKSLTLIESLKFER